VSWAGPGPAPVWLDTAREYTERWIHQQQMRDALDKPGMKERRWLAPVLETFVRALPHTLRDADAPEGTCVRLSIEGDAGGDWYAVKTSNGWVLAREVAGTPDATVRIDQENAWRLFTKGITKD